MVDSESRSRVSWEMSASRCEEEEGGGHERLDERGYWDGRECVLVLGCLVIELRFLSHRRWASGGY